MTDIKMLPLPTLFSTLSHSDQQRAINYARAVAEHNVNRERERAERLAEALRMIEKDSPVEAPDLNDWADADERVDVVENNLRWHFGKIARAALRDHDQEARET